MARGGTNEDLQHTHTTYLVGQSWNFAQQLKNSFPIGLNGFPYGDLVFCPHKEMGPHTVTV